jgi:hypothetical protein
MIWNKAFNLRNGDDEGLRLFKGGRQCVVVPPIKLNLYAVRSRFLDLVGLDSEFKQDTDWLDPLCLCEI